MFTIMKTNLFVRLLMATLALSLSAVADADEKKIDVSKESKRLARHFKGARVYYSAFGGFHYIEQDVRNVSDPPLQRLLREAGAIVVPITDARYDDIQIAYFRLGVSFLWVGVARRGKILFDHKYNLPLEWSSNDSEVRERLESMLIRDLDSEEVL